MEFRHGHATVRVATTKAVPERMRSSVREIVDLKTHVNFRRRGDATALMHEVCEAADKSGYLLLIKPDTPSLAVWYARDFGFQMLPDDTGLMVRPFDGTPRALSEAL